LNSANRKTVESLEERLLRIEMQERSRSIDLRVVMMELQSFQIDILKRFEELDKRMNDGLFGLAVKCDKMERAVQRFKP
jgi:hypothetical protein